MNPRNIRVRRGRIEIKIGELYLFLFWPYFVKNNVDAGLMAKTGFLLKGYNKWSETKAKSLVLLILGFGVGVQRMYEEI